MLWYADMQEFRPQNDRPNLSVLAPVTKDGRPAVCMPAIGERLSYTRRDWCFHVRPRRFLFVWLVFSRGRRVNISFCLRQQLRDRVSSSSPLLHHGRMHYCSLLWKLYFY